VVKSDDVSPEDASHALNPAESGSEGSDAPMGNVKGGVHNGTIVLLLRGLLKKEPLFVPAFHFRAQPYQVSFRGDGDENGVVAHPDLFALGALFGRRMDGPPTSLS